MPVEFIVNIAYDEIYEDYATVDVNVLLAGIPTRMALEVVCHYTAQVHTHEKDRSFQVRAIEEWTGRFAIETREMIASRINAISAKAGSNFNFINNVSSLLLIECILHNHNDLPVTDNLTPEQEENLFKAYLFFSAKWTKQQEAAAMKYRDISLLSMTLVMMLPYSELLEFKDFRLQFIKAVYFFKFCEADETFSIYLQAFLKARGVASWNQYLFNLVSVYIFMLGKGDVKSILVFDDNSREVFGSLEKFCIDVNEFEPARDFLTLRSKPIYRYSENELLFLNINFLIDKIYIGIVFDFADILITNKAAYKGRPIKNRQQFLGMFGDDFIEPGLFYQVMENVFRQKDYIHFSGSRLKKEFGDGVPDYLIVDNRKIYLFEFKNTFFSGPVKYSFDIDEIKNELERKFVINDQGSPKGITQLVNFIEDFSNGRYDPVIEHDRNSYIIYPILITTDFTFNLPVVYTLLLNRYREIVAANETINKKLQIKPITLIDFDNIIKFQDLFISKRLSLNHVLNDYQVFLARGNNEIDRSTSFNKYIHLKTAPMKYDSPRIFLEEIKVALFPDME